jgi:hypothetical protein
MHLGLYTHPLVLGDLEPHGGVRGIVEMGIGELVIAAAYHAGRWLVPSKSGAVVRFLEDGVVHADLRERYGTLQARASRLVGPGRPSPLEESCGLAKQAGLTTVAWVVLFHNTRLGKLHPESCVENAFGDRYEYALCPARPEVRQYGLALLRDIARTKDLDAVEIEAAGWMGHRHGSHHDKASFATDTHSDFLLSYCFCTACAAGLAANGSDVQALRARVCAVLRARFSDGDAMVEVKVPRERLATDLGRELERMLEHRRSCNAGLLREARAQLPPGMRLALHAEDDPCFTGSQVGIELARVKALVDEVVITRYGASADQIVAELGRVAFPQGLCARLAVWPRAPWFRSDADLRTIGSAAVAKGFAGVRIYHAALLPATTLARAARDLGPSGR